MLDQVVDQMADAVAARIIAQLSKNDSPKRLFTLAEAATYLGRSPKAVEHLIDRGVIPVTKLDGKRQIDRLELDRLITAHTFFAS